jgi:hypothetical protein
MYPFYLDYLSISSEIRQAPITRILGSNWTSALAPTGRPTRFALDVDKYHKPSQCCDAGHLVEHLDTLGFMKLNRKWFASCSWHSFQLTAPLELSGSLLKATIDAAGQH